MHQEQHFTVRELAALWKLSHDTILRWVENEPDVIVMRKDKPLRGKRQRRTFLIPDSVAARIHRKRRNRV